jgi:hypothetical protein
LRARYPLLRKAGAITRLEVYRRARLEQIRHNIIGRYEITVKEAYIKLKKAAQQMELTINQEKTKSMEVISNKNK